MCLFSALLVASFFLAGCPDKPPAGSANASVADAPQDLGSVDASVADAPRDLGTVGNAAGGMKQPERAPTTGASEVPVATGPLIVIARLADWGHAVPPCGRGHFITVMRYEIVRVVEGTLDGQDFFVAQSCPDMGWGPALSPFRVGETYRLSLRPFHKSDTNAASLVDAFAKDKRHRFVATVIAREPDIAQPQNPSKQP